MLSAYGPLVPYYLLAIAVAIATFWLIRRRGAARARPAGFDIRALERMRLREFEDLIRESFRGQGYSLIDPTRGATEGGELVLRRERETVLVQCRHWRDGKVGVEAIQALQHAMKQRGAGGGFILTTGRFAREAVAYAAGCNIRPIEGQALRALIDKPTGTMPLSAATR